MDKTFRIRLALVYLVIAGFGLAVIARSGFLMLRHSDRLQTASDRQFKQDQPPRLPRRGQILDRNHEPLAVSLDVKSVYANPMKIENKAQLAQELSSLLSLPLSQVKQRLKEKKGFVWLKRQLSEAEGVSVERWLQHNHSNGFGVGVATESKRFYPNQNLASTLLGFTNIDSRGIEGLEFRFDKELSARGPRSGLIEGDSLVLTIDKALQNIVERELEAGVASTSAKSATAIIMDAGSGDVLAMGSYPNFNPNSFKQAMPDWRRNRAITDTYEPGSTMKPILVTGALEAKLVTPATKVFCEYGKFQIGKHWIREAETKDKWGWLRVDEVIEKSSNVGATKIGFLFGADRLFNWYRQQGFTAKTGIDLPGEVNGSMPPLQSWAKINLSNISFGQGISITPIQLARAYATIANGGLQPYPHIVREWQSYEGELKHKTNVPPSVQVMQEQSAKAMQLVLSKVPTNDGTAPKAAIPGFVIAGKTGTAQKSFPGHGYKTGKYIASFVGFALNVEPHYVVYVMVDEPKFPYFGGEAAAPIFQKIMTATLAHAGIAPNPKLIPPPGQIPLRLGSKKIEKKQPAADVPAVVMTADGMYMPNLIGASAKDVMEVFDRRPINLSLRGSGVVVEQFPAAGVVFKKGESVSVRLDRGNM